MIFGDSQGQLHCINDTRMFSLSQAQHKGAVRSLCYSVHGEFVFSGAEDKTGVYRKTQMNNIDVVVHFTLSKNLVPIKSAKHLYCPNNKLSCNGMCTSQ